MPADPEPVDRLPGSGALSLLRTNNAFRRLTIARMVSFVGDSLSLVALMLHVAATSGQALAVAALLLVGDFARLRAVAGRVFQPASRAGIPALVAEKDLETASSTLGFGTNGAEALGPLVAAALLPLIGVPGVLLVDAASFAVSAILISRLPALPPAVEETADGPSTLLGQARAGLGYLWSQRPLRIILLGFCAVVAANGIDDVALLVLGRENLHTDESGVALLLGASGSGCSPAMHCWRAGPSVRRWSRCSSRVRRVQRR